MKLKASLLLNVLLCICPLTFTTKVLCLVAIVRFFVTFGRFSWRAVLVRPRPSILLTTSVIWSMKSHKACLTNHTRSIISHHCLLMPSEGGHTQHTHTHTHTHVYWCVIKINFKKRGACRLHSCLLSLSNIYFKKVFTDWFIKCYSYLYFQPFSIQ